MKKDIKRLIVLILALIITTIVVILINGRTATVDFELPKEEHKVSVENQSGQIEILETEEKNDKLLIKIKGVKPGKVAIDIATNDVVSTMKIIYVHKSMIVTVNSYIGNCNGDVIIPISASIVLIYLLYILIKEYINNKNKNLYQYRNVAYLGVIIFLSLFTLRVFLSIFNYGGLIHTINNIINSISIISFLILPIAFITFILVTISNISLIRKEGLSIRNLLGLLLGIFICLSTLLPDYIYGLLMNY